MHQGLGKRVKRSGCKLPGLPEPGWDLGECILAQPMSFVLPLGLHLRHEVNILSCKC